jgi:hypothetical protein
MPDYGVKIVADDDMPEDFDWMFARRHDGSLVLVMTRSASGCERALSEAWAAYRCIEKNMPIRDVAKEPQAL